MLLVVFNKHFQYNLRELPTKKEEKEKPFVARVLSYKMTLTFWNSIIVPGAKNSVQSDQMRIMGL